MGVNKSAKIMSVSTRVASRLKIKKVELAYFLQLWYKRREFRFSEFKRKKMSIASVTVAVPPGGVASGNGKSRKTNSGSINQSDDEGSINWNPFQNGYDDEDIMSYNHRVQRNIDRLREEEEEENRLNKLLDDPNFRLDLALESLPQEYMEELSAMLQEDGQNQGQAGSSKLLRDESGGGGGSDDENSGDENISDGGGGGGSDNGSGSDDSDDENSSDGSDESGSDSDNKDSFERLREIFYELYYLERRFGDEEVILDKEERPWLTLERKTQRLGERLENMSSNDDDDDEVKMGLLRLQFIQDSINRERNFETSSFYGKKNGKELHAYAWDEANELKEREQGRIERVREQLEQEANEHDDSDGVEFATEEEANRAYEQYVRPLLEQQAKKEALEQEEPTNERKKKHSNEEEANERAERARQEKARGKQPQLEVQAAPRKTKAPRKPKAQKKQAEYEGEQMIPPEKYEGDLRNRELYKESTTDSKGWVQFGTTSYRETIGHVLPANFPEDNQSYSIKENAEKKHIPSLLTVLAELKFVPTCHVIHTRKTNEKKEQQLIYMKSLEDIDDISIKNISAQPFVMLCMRVDFPFDLLVKKDGHAVWVRDTEVKSLSSFFATLEYQNEAGQNHVKRIRRDRAINETKEDGKGPARPLPLIDENIIKDELQAIQIEPDNKLNEDEKKDANMYKKFRDEAKEYYYLKVLPHMILKRENHEGDEKMCLRLSPFKKLQILQGHTYSETLDKSNLLYEVTEGNRKSKSKYLSEDSFEVYFWLDEINSENVLVGEKPDERTCLYTENITESNKNKMLQKYAFVIAAALKFDVKQVKNEVKKHEVILTQPWTKRFNTSLKHGFLDKPNIYLDFQEFEFKVKKNKKKKKQEEEDEDEEQEEVDGNDESKDNFVLKKIVKPVVRPALMKYALSHLQRLSEFFLSRDRENAALTNISEQLTINDDDERTSLQLCELFCQQREALVNYVRNLTNRGGVSNIITTLLSNNDRCQGINALPGPSQTPIIVSNTAGFNLTV